MQLTFSRALRIYPNDKYNIPFPNMVFTDTVYSLAPSGMFDPTKNFIQLGIQIGDTIFNADYNDYSVITSVEENYLYFADDIFAGSGETYEIFQGVNTGCYIIPNADQSGIINLSVITAGGDSVFFFGLTPGVVLPVKILRVNASDSQVDKIIALW
jgi:hypothetical protein